jgi:hypothetical protein
VQQLVPAGQGGAHAVLLVADRVERAAERALQQLLDGLALGPPQAARDVVGGGEVVDGQRARRVQVRGPVGARQRLGQVALEQRREARGRILAGHEVAGQRGVQVVGGDAAAPEVVGGLGHPVGVALHQLHLQRHLRGERRVGQRALAEAMDREDGRLVEGGLREREPRDHVGGLQPVLLARAAHQAFDELVAGSGRLAGLLGPQPGERIHDALADALAQFGRGRVGERDHEDALHLQPLLEQQSQVQAADVPGLAGAGRRLDLADAVQRAGEDVQRLEVGHGGHRAASWTGDASATETWPARFIPSPGRRATARRRLGRWHRTRRRPRARTDPAGRAAPGGCRRPRPRRTR